MINIENLYDEKTMSIKRGIMIDLLDAVMISKLSNIEVLKLHIDGALDRLEKDVYLPFINGEHLDD